ncbi:protein of unknown function [Pararobbsia alpina]
MAASVIAVLHVRAKCRALSVVDEHSGTTRSRSDRRTVVLLSPFRRSSTGHRMPCAANVSPTRGQCGGRA